MVWKAALAALILAGGAGAANGRILTGNDLLAACESPTGSFLRAQCLGYLEGVFDRDAIARWEGAPHYICALPDGVTIGQLFDVVVAYLKENPAVRQQQAASLAATAVREAFCTK